MTTPTAEVEDGRPFGYTFMACFLFFFGGAVLYLAFINSSSMVTLVESLYGILGIAMIVIGLYCVARALTSGFGMRKKVAPTNASGTPSTATSSETKM